MNKLARWGVLLVLALAFTASPLMTMSADAGNGNGRGRGRGPRWEDRGNGGGQGNRGSGNSGGYRSNPGYGGGERDGGYRNNDGYAGGYRGYQNNGGYRSYPGYRNYPGRFGERRVYVRRNSGIVPFIGGLAVGTIIGSEFGHHNSYYCAPPPPPRPVRVIHRVYVYRDDTCNLDFTSYDDWIDHLVTYHRVPACDVRDMYPMYDGGYWEEY